MNYISYPEKIKNNIEKEQIIKVSKQYDYDWSNIRIFQIVICDNQINEDNVKFSTSVLFEIKKQIIGKKIVCGTTWQNRVLTAQIFNCDIRCLSSTDEMIEEPMLYLIADVYFECDYNNDYSDLYAAIKNNYYVGAEINYTVNLYTTNNLITTIYCIKDVKCNFVINPKKKQCPLKEGIDECFGQSTKCKYVEQKDCNKYMKIYNYGRNIGKIKKD